MKQKEKNKKKKSNITTSDNNTLPKVEFTEDKIQAMRDLAQRLAKKLSQEEKPSTNKASFQLELELERQEKLKKKQDLKKLNAQELLHYNKEKAKQKEDDTINKVDGYDTNVSFSNALEYSEKTAELHRVLISGKVKDPSVVVDKVKHIQKNIANINNNTILEAKSSCDAISEGKTSSRSDSSHRQCESDRNSRKYKKGHREKLCVDTSGTVEGEEVEGLVKRETKKIRQKKQSSECKTSQDDFILGKLFSKKGI